MVYDVCFRRGKNDRFESAGALRWGRPSPPPSIFDPNLCTLDRRIFDFLYIHLIFRFAPSSAPRHRIEYNFDRPYVVRKKKFYFLFCYILYSPPPHDNISAGTRGRSLFFSTIVFSQYV